jgi:DUF1680 family protein
MLIVVPSPKAKGRADYHRAYDYSSDLRPAKQGSVVSLHGNNPKLLMSGTARLGVSLSDRALKQRYTTAFSAINDKNGSA